MRPSRGATRADVTSRSVPQREGANFKQNLNPAGLPPSPLPRRFLEVLILKDFYPKCPEVLIIVDLVAVLLILLVFKSFVISDLTKNK